MHCHDFNIDICSKELTYSKILDTKIYLHCIYERYVSTNCNIINNFFFKIVLNGRTSPGKRTERENGTSM